MFHRTTINHGSVTISEFRIGQGGLSDLGDSQDESFRIRIHDVVVWDRVQLPDLLATQQFVNLLGRQFGGIVASNGLNSPLQSSFERKDRVRLMDCRSTSLGVLRSKIFQELL